MCVGENDPSAHAKAYIHMCSPLFPYMQCGKGHTFSTGQRDNTSEVDKQLVASVAAYKSDAERDGLLYHGGTLISGRCHMESDCRPRL